MCATTTRLDPPLVLERGDGVHVSLHYDLARLVRVSDVPSSWGGCAREGGQTYCFDPEGFTVTAVRTPRDQ